LKAMPVNSCIGFKDLERFLANMVLQKRWANDWNFENDGSIA
jgi:hypothetical protein